MVDYRHVFESGLKQLPQAIEACRKAGVSDEEVLALCADLGKYFVAVGKLKNADELPSLLEQKRMRALDGRIVKRCTSLFETVSGLGAGIDFSGVPEEEGDEPEEVIEQMVFEDPAAVQEVTPTVIAAQPAPAMSFAQAVVGDKMKEYIAQVRGQA